MKKTLTVNLGGTVFHIDEDAYQLLDKYLSNLRIHFRHEEGSEEIMNDFEMRISELLGERVRLGYEVITIQQVEEVIKRMGKPEEIFEDEENGRPHEEASAHQTQETHTQTVKRRFMRDPDNRILGGVAGGFAAYMDWDPTAVRIGLFLLMFFYGITIPIYFFLWIIVPMARTATEKLQMRGESVTIENIGKTVTEGFEKVSTHVNEYIKSDKPRSTLQKIADAFVEILGLVLKALLILLAIVTLPPLILALFVVIVVIIAVLLGGGIGFLHSLPPFADWNMLTSLPQSALIIGTLSAILTVGIPLLLIVFAVGSQFFKMKPLTPSMRWVLVILFVIAFLINIFYASKYGLAIWDSTNWHPWHVDWNSVKYVIQSYF